MIVLFLLSFCFGSQAAAAAAAATSTCHSEDLKALLEFKAGVSYLNHWNGTDCCLWDAVQCSVTTGRVVSLIFEGIGGPDARFSYEHMNGTVSGSLGKLVYLEVLVMKTLPSLSGAIPDSFGELSRLTQLSLDTTALNGSIPPSLGKLSSLRYLSLSRNKLTGSIPPELASLQTLEDLDLHGNALTGSIPSSNFGAQLRKLELSENQLSGHIPESLGGEQLESLDLSFNRLSGTIPLRLLQLRSLQQLDLSNNTLSGKIPKGGERFSPDSFAKNPLLCGRPLRACKT